MKRGRKVFSIRALTSIYANGTADQYKSTMDAVNFVTESGLGLPLTYTYVLSNFHESEELIFATAAVPSSIFYFHPTNNDRVPFNPAIIPLWDSFDYTVIEFF